MLQECEQLQEQVRMYQFLSMAQAPPSDVVVDTQDHAEEKNQVDFSHLSKILV